MSRILIVGKGGFGDLFPLFAIAEELKAANHRVTIAAEGHHAPAAASIGVQLVELDADAPAGGTQIEIFRTLAPANIEREYECIVDEVRASDLVIGNHLSYSGSIAAKKLHRPWIFCAPSPLAILSRQDPPVFPYLHGVQSISRHFGFSQIPFIDLARFTSQLMMHSNIRL